MPPYPSHPRQATAAFPPPTTTASTPLSGSARKASIFCIPHLPLPGGKEGKGELSPHLHTFYHFFCGQAAAKQGSFKFNWLVVGRHVSIAARSTHRTFTCRDSAAAPVHITHLPSHAVWLPSSYFLPANFPISALPSCIACLLLAMAHCMAGSKHACHLLPHSHSFLSYHSFFSSCY